MKTFAKILLAVILIVWVVAPDFIPGPIDDIVAILLVISDIKSIGQPSACD